MASLLWDGEVGMATKVRRWERKGEGVEGEDLEGEGLYKETNMVEEPGPQADDH